MVAVLVAGNWAYAVLNDTSSENGNDDTVRFDTRVTFEQPSIETNADVEGDLQIGRASCRERV